MNEERKEVCLRGKAKLYKRQNNANLKWINLAGEECVDVVVVERRREL